MDNIKNFFMSNKKLLAVIVVLAAVVAAAFFVFSQKGEGKYDNLSTDAPIYSSGVDDGVASQAAGVGAGVYQYSWNMIINGEFDDDMSNIPNVDPDYATAADFPAMRTTENVIDFEGVFVGPRDIVNEIYVEKAGSNDTYNVFVCEKQDNDDVRRISVSGNANRVAGKNGWRVIVANKNGNYVAQSAVEDVRMCGASGDSE